MGAEQISVQSGPNHLISDEWLVAYAAGTLSEAKSALVATHASYHPVLRQKIRSAESIGGALLEASPASVFSDGFYDRLLERLDGEDNDNNPPQNLDILAKDTVMPEPLVKYLDRSLDDLKWRFMGPGMSQVKLHSTDDGEKLWLLKAKGGTEIPAHGHNGHEFTLVLQGSYSVDGHTYSVGDMELASDVTEAPINLKSFAGRLFQPFIGL